jgi:hypothetical protein
MEGVSTFRDGNLYRLFNNPIGREGERASVEAIAANEDTALVEISGAELCEWLDVLGLSDDFRDALNWNILAHMRARRLADRVKSARGGAVK